MALHDLKKKPQASKLSKQYYDVDSFIDEAELYANGYHNVVKLPLPQLDPEPMAAHKNATFSFSIHAIEQLSELKQQTGLNKSLLLRSLTRYLHGLDQAQRDILLNKANEKLNKR
ncbi:hypothetical protein M0C34_00185 [Agarivorans sp. TSD2052]|uniref:hypothetical protein n=1 Tax=Agarivorans sp. TSD2052 TaxID=2937286 RepID=UPI0020100CA4|nr:hypothetical protein [Agarivorans sp. TSD2052]UPW18726.1 hypothetical protein M0C34_00185 [Agarivorans sp. TSD2052]